MWIQKRRIKGTWRINGTCAFGLVATDLWRVNSLATLHRFSSHSSWIYGEWRENLRPQINLALLPLFHLKSAKRIRGGKRKNIKITVETLLVSTMGWLRSVASIKLYVSFAELCLFYRALSQKRPIILSILLTEATPYTEGWPRNLFRGEKGSKENNWNTAGKVKIIKKRGQLERLLERKRGKANKKNVKEKWESKV